MALLLLWFVFFGLFQIGLYFGGLWVGLGAIAVGVVVLMLGMVVSSC